LSAFAASQQRRKTILVVANETLGGRRLIETVRSRAAAGHTRFVLCVPQNRPKAGLVIYDHMVFDAAQARVDLALSVLHSESIEAIGEVGDPDPYSATMDAVYEYNPTEIVISTYPETRSGWLRKDLIQRVREASRLPVEHIVSDPDTEGLPFDVTLAVANRTATGDELFAALNRKVEEDKQHDRRRVVIVVVPQEGGHGTATRRARTRLKLVLGRLHRAGIFAAGLVGDPDPYTAITNALQYFRVDDVVISTFAGTKSGWLRSDLIERVRRSTDKPVEHVVHHEHQRSAA
jgi:hypothetical protein